MSTNDTTDGQDNQLDEITLGITLHGGDSIATQLVIHGLTPGILITPTDQGDGVLHFKIDATGPTTTGNLADTLEALVYALRNGELRSMKVNGVPIDAPGIHPA